MKLWCNACKKIIERDGRGRKSFKSFCVETQKMVCLTSVRELEIFKKARANDKRFNRV